MQYAVPHSSSPKSSSSVSSSDIFCNTCLKNQRLFRSPDDGLTYYTNPRTNRQERVWHPDGPPGPNPDVEASDQTYEVLGQALKDAYDYVRETGTFKDGIMPEVPPRRGWVEWEV